MKIAVLGGAGLTGQCAVRDLIRSKVDEILVGDYNRLSLKTLKSKLGKIGADLQFRVVDVTDRDETARLLRSYDVVINAVQYYYNLNVMQAALDAGANYLDFGGLFHTTLEQIKRFDKSYKSAGLVGVAGMGAQPGVTNLMVKSALQNLDKADSVEIFDGWRDDSENASPLSFTWSPLTFFDESSKPAIVFQNGKYSTRPPFSEPETVRFPKPVGEVQVYLALHSEIATIPRSFKRYRIKKAVWKEGGTDIWKIKFLADLGLTSDESVRFDSGEISPRKFLIDLLTAKGLLQSKSDAVPRDYEITRVIVKGRASGRKKTVVVDARFPAFRPWRVSCSQYNVGIPGSIAAQTIASGQVSVKGVLPAELVFEPRAFFKELERRSIRISQRTFER